jgi:hypothetical protein
MLPFAAIGQRAAALPAEAITQALAWDGTAAPTALQTMRIFRPYAKLDHAAG